MKPHRRLSLVSIILAIALGCAGLAAMTLPGCAEMRDSPSASAIGGY